MSAFLLLTLNACVTSGNRIQVEGYSIPQVPAELRDCEGEFKRLVKLPEPGPMSKAQALDLIAKLRRSEVAKSYCGRRVFAWLDRYVEGKGR